MPMTIWIAKLMGPVIVALAIPMIATPERLLETTRRFLDDSPLILVTGILAMIAGLAMVNVHNIWVAGWPVIITLLGWAFLVGGAIRILAPGAVKRIGGRMMVGPVMTRAAGVLWLALGAFLTFKGYA